MKSDNLFINQNNSRQTVVFFALISLYHTDQIKSIYLVYFFCSPQGQRVLLFQVIPLRVSILKTMKSQGARGLYLLRKSPPLKYDPLDFIIVFMLSIKIVIKNNNIS